MEGRGQGVHADALLILLDGHRLSPVQRRIAQYLLDHKPDSAFLSSVVLARRAGVSQPSVTRFAAVLGFSGYPAFRDALRVIALDAPGAAVPSAPGPPGLDDAGNPMQAAVAAEIANAPRGLERVVFCCFSADSAEHHRNAFAELGPT